MAKSLLAHIGLKTSSESYHRQIAKKRQAVADADERYALAVHNTVSGAGSIADEAAALRRLTDAKAELARLEAGLGIAERAEAKEAAAKAAEARRKRNEATITTCKALLA